jgi:hypothetical protein
MKYCSTCVRHSVFSTPFFLTKYVPNHYFMLHGLCTIISFLKALHVAFHIHITVILYAVSCFLGIKHVHFSFCQHHSGYKFIYLLKDASRNCFPMNVVYVIRNSFNEMTLYFFFDDVMYNKKGEIEVICLLQQFYNRLRDFSYSLPVNKSWN